MKKRLSSKTAKAAYFTDVPADNGLRKGNPTLLNRMLPAKDPYPHGEPIELVFSKTKFRDGKAYLEFDFSAPILGDMSRIGQPLVIYKNQKMIAVCCSIQEAANYFNTTWAIILGAIKRGGLWKGHVIMRISKRQFEDVFNAEIPRR